MAIFNSFLYVYQRLLNLYILFHSATSDSPLANQPDPVHEVWLEHSVARLHRGLGSWVNYGKFLGFAHLGMGQNPIPLVNIKIAGKLMFIPLKNGMYMYV